MPDMELSERELVEAAFDITGGNVAALDEDQLNRLVTIVQFVFDLCFNELDARGMLEMQDGMFVMPYASDHAIQTRMTSWKPPNEE